MHALTSCFFIALDGIVYRLQKFLIRSVFSSSFKSVLRVLETIGPEGKRLINRFVLLDLVSCPFRTTYVHPIKYLLGRLKTEDCTSNEYQVVSHQNCFTFLKIFAKCLPFITLNPFLTSKKFVVKILHTMSCIGRLSIKFWLDCNMAYDCFEFRINNEQHLIHLTT